MSEEVKTINGLTITLTFGSYGGFYAVASRMSCRICLGWIAFTVYFIDIEAYIEKLLEEAHE